MVFIRILKLCLILIKKNGSLNVVQKNLKVVYTKTKQKILNIINLPLKL